jgi:hypothetical protein
MSTSIIAPGGQIDKDPSDWTVLTFDWAAHLAADAELVDKGVLVITDEDPIPDTLITLLMDEFAILGDNKSVTFRLKDGTPGHLYKISHFIETNETPQQKRDRSFFLWVRQK